MTGKRRKRTEKVRAPASAGTNEEKERERDPETREDGYARGPMVDGIK